MKANFPNSFPTTCIIILFYSHNNSMKHVVLVFPFSHEKNISERTTPFPGPVGGRIRIRVDSDFSTRSSDSSASQGKKSLWCFHEALESLPGPQSPCTDLPIVGQSHLLVFRVNLSPKCNGWEIVL